MAEVLLLGMTHFPRLRLPDEQWNLLLLKMLSDPDVPAHMKEPANWPRKMREQWGDDNGLTAAKKERQELTADFAIMRDELERFGPDIVIIWGDDQYENFREDAIPPFAVLAYDAMEVDLKNVQLEKGSTLDSTKFPANNKVSLRGNRQAAKHLTSGLIEKGFDITYAYQPRHLAFGHAFANTLLYLAQGHGGFPWNVIPFPVNCYGRTVVSHRGMPRGLSEVSKPEDLDPISPMPWRCFDLGRACARVAAESPWRVALIASSSWSHAFLTRKNFYLYPDMDADIHLFQSLKDGRFDEWRSRTLQQIEDSGQQEVLNWMCLVGAFAEMKATPRYARFHESYIFNSPKVFVSGGG